MVHQQVQAAIKNLNLASLEQMSDDDLIAIAESDELDSKTQRTLVELAMLKYQAAIESGDEDNHNSYSMPEWVEILAGNTKLSTVNCRKLATLQSERVIAAVARNPNTPTSILRQFCSDSSKHFQFTIASIIDNPNCPRTLALTIAMNETLLLQDDVIDALLEYEGWTEADLKRLARMGIEGFEEDESQ